jgi:nucleoid-associated protein YgaU
MADEKDDKNKGLFARVKDYWFPGDAAEEGNQEPENQGRRSPEGKQPPAREDDRVQTARREADATRDAPQRAQQARDEQSLNRKEAEERATPGSRQASVQQRREEQAAQSGMPSAAPGAGAARAQGKKHTVAEGETLSHISLKYYGSATRWQEIYEANKGVIGDNPNKIYVGQELVIPGA